MLPRGTDRVADVHIKPHLIDADDKKTIKRSWEVENLWRVLSAQTENVLQCFQQEPILDHLGSGLCQ